MSNEYITIDDCLEMYYMKDKAAVITAGQVVEFRKEDKQSWWSQNLKKL